MTAQIQDEPARVRLSASAVSWSLFETGRTSYSVLISIYVFIPYVAAVLVGDAVQGQKLVADLGKWAGLAAALTAPLLGATIDHLGPRRPALALLTVLLAPLAVSLWWAAPDGGLSVTAIAWILAASGVLFGLCEVLHNAMLVYAARPGERPYASGLAMAFGNGTSVLLMVFALWAFMLPGVVHAPGLVPTTPLFGLDVAKHEPERIMGPLIAGVLLLTALPMLLLARDAPATGLGLWPSLRLGARDLRGLLRVLAEAPAARRFLIARLIFADGQMGIIMFTGVFAAGVFGWGATQLMIEGLTASVFAALGGLLAGVLDTRIGPKKALILSLVATAVFVVGEIGMGPDRIFYVWAYDPLIHGRPWSGPIFNTWPEIAFIACDLGVSVFVVSGLASSRTMMAQLAPTERSAAFFGLYALSGRATAWLCPMLVGLATAAFASQQLGLIPIVVLLVIGLVLLLAVPAPRAPRAPRA